MTCKDCLHYEACDMYEDLDGYRNKTICENFSDRSQCAHLPCKVGTKVFALLGRKESVIETFVEKIIVNKNNGMRLKLGANSMYETSERSIGKTVFFAREEAVKALEKRSR